MEADHGGLIGSQAVKQCHSRLNAFFLILIRSDLPVRVLERNDRMGHRITRHKGGFSTAVQHE